MTNTERFLPQSHSHIIIANFHRVCAAIRTQIMHKQLIYYQMVIQKMLALAIKR